MVCFRTSFAARQGLDLLAPSTLHCCFGKLHHDFSTDTNLEEMTRSLGTSDNCRDDRGNNACLSLMSMSTSALTPPRIFLRASSIDHSGSDGSISRRPHAGKHPSHCCHGALAVTNCIDRPHHALPKTPSCLCSRWRRGGDGKDAVLVRSRDAVTSQQTHLLT